MASPELGEFARSLAVMVRVRGPDPKGLKMRGHAFHHYSHGQTTLSASGVLLPETLFDATAAERLLGANSCQGYGLVLTVVSVIEPFLTLEQRQSISQHTPPKLITGAEIDVLFEVNVGQEEQSADGPLWIGATLLKLVNIPVAALGFQSLIQQTSSTNDIGWEIGWSLASFENDSPEFVNYSTKQVENSTKGARNMRENFSEVVNKNTSVAILAVPLPSKNIPHVNCSSSYKRGDFILAAGSPFGILSPLHFLNSMCKGSIANCYHSGIPDLSLLFADIRCLPGMEGGPIFSESSELIGILIRPLRQRSSGAEIQLVIPWKAIASSDSDLLRQGVESSPNIGFENVMSSICLITIDEGLWASGIVLNEQGLILTNAHLVEPWRFRKATMNDGERFSESKALPFPANGRRIRVRLDHINPWIWMNAKVKFICNGPLDIALLQLDHVPSKLTPIEADFTSPSPGSLAYVIGHGLFGPKCGFSPSVCSGVVAKVVNAKSSLYHDSGRQQDKEIPVMILTTAAVHPGGSGGTVINSNGHMIGLVTSNTRHGGGTVIPHLNFSIPSAALTPIFQYAKDMQNMSLLEDLNQSNEELSLIWALVAPVAPKNRPNPLMVTRDVNEEEKGSKFARFLAERNRDRQPNGTISSKL